MALYVLQPGIQPLGQFDFLDADKASLVGGLIGTWGTPQARTNSSTEYSAADARDGYVASGVSESSNTATRPVIKLANDTTTDESKAMYLLDDGIAGYGTLFGSVIGMFNPTGTAVGPNTYTGSGKVTMWDKPGLYAVTFEACYSDKNVTNGALEVGQDTPLPGDLLYRHSSTAKICRLATAAQGGCTAALNKVGAYVEHRSNGSLVTTPAKLVGATEAWDRIVMNYFGFGKNL